MRESAGDPQPLFGPPVLVVVVPPVPVRVGGDRVDLRGLGPDLVGGRSCRCGQEHRGTHALREHHEPFQGPHAAHRSADDHGETVDAELVGEQGFDSHLIAGGHPRPPRPVGTAVDCRACRPGGPLAPAQNVGADDEPAVGVQGLAGSDQRVPPSRCGLARCDRPRGVGVAGEGVFDQDDVVPLAVERAPRLVGDPNLRQ